nr:transcriptional repressor NrdR [Bacteroidota bacterium]
MECPFCGSEQLFVINSRSTKNNSQIWRRRKCESCQEIFTTYEKADLSYLKVIKRSGKKQMYNRAKLYSGIYHSAIDTKNGDRGEMSELSETLTNEVEQKIILLRSKDISTIEIINIVLSVLRKRSSAIFLRYLAYREGKDEKRLKKLIKKHFLIY